MDGITLKHLTEPTGCLNVSETLPLHSTAAVRDRQILQMFLLMDQKKNGVLKGRAAPQEQRVPKR